MMFYEKVVKWFVLMSLDDVFYDFGRELFEIFLCARLEGHELIKIGRGCA
jgi:hypothetical protein